MKRVKRSTAPEAGFCLPWYRDPFIESAGLLRRLQYRLGIRSEEADREIYCRQITEEYERVSRLLERYEQGEDITGLLVPEKRKK